MRFKLWLETQVIGSGDVFVADGLRVYLTSSSASGSMLFQFIKSLHAYDHWSLEDITEEFSGMDIWRALAKIYHDSSSAVYGRIERDKLVVMNAPNLAPSSLMLKRLSQTLGNRKIIIQGRKMRPTGAVGLVFHGTAEKYLSEIRTKGLVPNSNGGNWGLDITGAFSDNNRPISLTTDFNVAKGHATRTGQLTGTKPIVLTIRIPDPSKIGWDYDAFNQDAEEDPSWNPVSSIRRMNRSTRETGLFSYDGRVPPSHIIKITYIK